MPGTAWATPARRAAARPGTFDGCSYALAELDADTSSEAVELAVAGVGVGFCDGPVAPTPGAGEFNAGPDQRSPPNARLWTPR